MDGRGTAVGGEQWLKSGPDPLFSGYLEVNAVNSAGTGAVKSKFVHMSNSVNALKILVGLYF